MRQLHFFKWPMVCGVLLAASGIAVVSRHPGKTVHAAETPQGLTMPGALQPQLEQLLALLGQGKVDEMLTRMPVGVGETRDDFQTLRHDLSEVTAGAGRYIGFDVVETQALSSRYEEVFVLAYFANQPLLMEFGFYKPADVWQVQHFRTRTSLYDFLDSRAVRRF